MARYKPYDYNQPKFIAVDFKSQILPGTFEYSLNHIVDNKLDLSLFDARYKNDETGAPAYDPAILLKIVLYAYSRGITSSRQIERLCRENIIFMALSADSQPHFTTIADFVSGLHQEIEILFTNVLLVCDEMNLIGRDMFAIDGCKLPSNASKEWSGTKTQLTRKKEKMQKAVSFMLKQHKDNDAMLNDEVIQRQQQQIETLNAQIDKLSDWLANNEDKIGSRNKPIKSNLTDNESANIRSSKGTIQGYNGVAAADNKHQVITYAEAFGQGPENDLLMPMIKGIRENFQSIKKADPFKTTKLCADSGFSSKAMLKDLAQENIDAYIADGNMRKRDPRFADTEKYRERHKKERRAKAKKQGNTNSPCYTPADFIYDEANKTCLCPAGKKLYLNGSHCNIDGKEAVRFHGTKRDCLPCKQRQQCLRKPDTTIARQVSFFKGRSPKADTDYLDLMRQKIDSDEGRHQYSKRISTIEPVFANICKTIGLDRFSFRGKKKVDMQWKLFCTIHNLFKIHRYGTEKS